MLTTHIQLMRLTAMNIAAREVKDPRTSHINRVLLRAVHAHLELAKAEAEIELYAKAVAKIASTRIQ